MFFVSLGCCKCKCHSQKGILSDDIDGTNSEKRGEVKAELVDVPVPAPVNEVADIPLLQSTTSSSHSVHSTQTELSYCQRAKKRG